MIISTVTRRALVLLTAAGLLLAGPVTARADDRPTVSFDGEHWGSSVAQPLWDEGVRWVPGDRRTVSLWLRNDATEPSRFAIAVIVQNVDEDAEAPHLTASVRIGDTRLAVGSRPVALPEFAPSVRRRVDLTLALPAADPNHDQLRRAEIRVEISTSPPLPMPTGGVVEWPIPVAALLLAAAGLLAVRQLPKGRR